MTARKFSYSNNPQSDFYKESESNKKTKKKFWRLGGEGVGVRLGSVIFFHNPSLKKNVFFLRGVRVRENWLV